MEMPYKFCQLATLLVLMALGLKSGRTCTQLAVELPGGMEEAKAFAKQENLVFLAEVIPQSNIFHFEECQSAKRKRKRKKRDLHQIRKRILRNTNAVSVQVLKAKERVKRGPIFSLPRKEFIPRDDNRKTPELKLNDPLWSHMWYLNRLEGLNMNVAEAWNMGITGKGVAVTILDDGIEKDHPDLIRNYDPLASTDINDNDSDPNPRYDFSDSNRHGTRCAGQVAASPNNSFCGIGVAYNSMIGGIRMLDGQVSDAVEARSLSFNPDHIDIYSSSWGPNDDGKTVDGPGKLASRAFKNGITRGRRGKGSIFVWASGNGGRYKDNCNCDGYATSIYTITVSSTSESGNIPWYSEPCSSTLATTYSSGTTSERQIVTTDLHHGCTEKHTGTSASAPMAAAIIALALEANPNLTWRDVQHIIVRTSQPLNLRAHDWTENAMGRSVSHSYGYGLMDAGAMVKAAKNWTLVPKQQKCLVSSPYYEKLVPAMGYIVVKLDVKDCPNIRHLEHVVVPTYVTVGRKRGDLRIYVQSPSGTRSSLLDIRPQDYSNAGFIDWPFMSVHHWGENPTGTWTLEVHNDAFSKWAPVAKFHKWSLELFGIQNDPNEKSKNNKDDSRNNVVREAKHGNETTQSTAPMSRTTTTTTTESPRVVGCVSKTVTCTKNIKECRTFSERKVADFICDCTRSCSEVGRQAGRYNMQCDMTPSAMTKTVPSFCFWIPIIGS